MDCFFVAQINIEDSDEYQRYLAGYDEVFSKFNGTVLAADDDVEILEGDWPFGRTVIVRFPSPEELLKWYRSPEYEELARHRRNASSANIALVHGR